MTNARVLPMHRQDPRSAGKNVHPIVLASPSRHNVQDRAERDQCGRRNATGEPTMAKFTYDHIHLRSPDPEATARWYERVFGAEVLRSVQQGKPRIDLKLGGANIFIAPVAAGDGVNPPPTTPYQGLDHFGLTVSGIDAIVADLKAKGVEFTRDPQ